MTGERVRVGNFSVVPFALLRRLVAVSDLWNHYAAAVFRSRIPYRTVPTSRGPRYHGESQMNYTALVTHGLSAMSVFGDRIAVRLLAVTTLVALAAIAGLGIGQRGTTNGSSWAPAGLVALVLFQAVVAALTFVFLVLGHRDTSTFVPLRDYRWFVYDVRSLRSR